jgi:hypothetical protein
MALTPGEEANIIKSPERRLQSIGSHMYLEEKTFMIRFSLEVSFPDDYEGDEDQLIWVQEWENLIKPHLMKSLFESLRQHPAWKSRIRNRGISPADEIEVVLSRDPSKPNPFSLSS